METKIIYVFIFLVYSLSLIGQIKDCDKLNTSHIYGFDKENVHNTSDYIKQKFPEKVKYISNRFNLTEIPVLSTLNNEVVFYSDEISMKLTFKDTSISVLDYFYPKRSDEKISKIVNDEKAPYGIISEDSSASKIESIELNSIMIPSSAFEDLLNPNQALTYISIKPMGLYESKCKDFLYLYIFGRVDERIIPEYEAIRFSYMAKLIFDKNGKYLGRIVERGHQLINFGFDRCSSFIGF